MNDKIKIGTIIKKVMRGEFHNEEVPIYITTDNNRHTTEENANNHQNYLDKIEELKNEKSLIDSKIQSFQKQIEHIDKLEFYELNKEGREAYEIGC